jgi:hypothetical protein
MGGSLNDRETFRKLTEEIADQVREASGAYDLYVKLRRAVSDYNREINQARNFWSRTLNGLLETVRMSLCRLYDQEQSALGLRRWLEMFRDDILSPELYEESIREQRACDPLREDEIEQDVQLVSAKDLTVKRLIAQRGNALAHVNARNVAKGLSIFDKFPLTYADFDELIARAQLILNRYSVLFSGTAYAFLTEDRDDYVTILNAIRSQG